MPGLGASGGKFQLSLGWRYAEAHRSYFNSRLNHDFTRLWDPYEKLSLLDVTGRYNLNSRVSLTASLPIVFNRFSMLFPPAGTTRGLRRNWSPRGVGDLSLYSSTWMLSPKEHPFFNYALGLGIKIPTGSWNLHATMPDETGRNFRRRTVYPPAVMPGDGGVGILVGFETFKVIRKEMPFLTNSTVFASANYLINPRDTNGTPSMIQSLGVPLAPYFSARLRNSVADSYNGQVGISMRVPHTWDKPNLKGLRFRLVGHCEGLNTRDLIGGSHGFRQPGYTMSIGPGLTYARKKDFFSVDIPIVFNRHINPNETLLPGVPDARTGAPAPLNINRQMGLVAPVSVSVRYIRSI